MKFIVIALFILGLSVAVEAKEPKEIKIGNETYTYGQVIADFLDVAFSEKMWNEDAFYPDSNGYVKMLDVWHGAEKWDIRNKKTYKSYQDAKRHSPWFAEYMYRPEGLPRHNVIHKWDREITVAIGWPRYNPSSTNPISIKNSYRSEGSEKLYPIIEEIVGMVLPEIQELTGLETRFLSPDDPRENTSDYARIRIIPTKPPMARGVVEVSPSSWEPETHEKWLWGGVPFETSNASQMYGYLLPDADDTLGLVVCKIGMDLEKEIIKVLIGECLVRSLGLPDLSKVTEKALLGNWRASKISDDDVYTISDYDKYMLGMLYCSAIQSGMDKNKVFEILLKSNQCFLTIK